VYGDFSRLSFSRSSQYSGVWAQQGRVQLDADLNEQTAIMLDYLRTLTVDLIGPFGGHASAGFRVSLCERDGEPGVELSPGHYYVYGLRCVSPLPAAPDRRGATSTAVEITLPEAPFFVELFVWEQTVTAIQDPRLIEPALGLRAPDTTVRSQVRWKVLAGRRLPRCEEDLAGDEAKLDVIEKFVEHQRNPAPPPLLRARAVALPAGGAGDDPSVLPTASGYRGVENQLYRVEVHTGGGAQDATFKWSRDNGSVELPVRALTGPDGDAELTAVVPTSWKDPRAGLEAGDWVELIDDLWHPAGRPGALMSVQSVDPVAGQVKLSQPDRGITVDPALHPFLRRWDQRPDDPASDNACPVIESAHGHGWLDLEDGVQIQFLANDARYERGDYWLLPARTTTGGLLWPGSATDPKALAPDGPARYRAPLAIVDGDGQVIDLRERFGHVSKLHDGDDAPAPVFHGEPPTTVSPQAPAFRLRSVAAFAPGVVYDLGPGETRVGRSNDSHILLSHPDVSRNHAVLRVDEASRLTIEDGVEGRPSGNGTLVNGKKIAPGHAIELAVGDVIRFGTQEVETVVEQVEEMAGGVKSAIHHIVGRLGGHADR
jgi:hypothetical protein